MKNHKVLNKACLLLVEHFKDCIEGNVSIHTRIFSHFLHPEIKYVGSGQSQAVLEGESSHLEHIVPCAILINETCRLIGEKVSNNKIAELLAKHWKVAYISKSEAEYLDSKDGLNLKKTMPKGWDFETGDTYARIKKAKINLLPL